MDNPTELWQATTAQLELRMTRDTFNTIIRPARAVSLADGVLTIHAPAKEWLENRLADMVNRAASEAAGRAIQVIYVNGDQPPLPVEVAPREPAAAVPHTLDYNPRKRLWAKHPLIISRFYPSYFVRVAGRIIGSICLPTWRYLLDQHDMSKSDDADWTPPKIYTLGGQEGLASALGVAVTHLSGRLRTCHHFDNTLKETGEIIPCCRRFRGARMGETQFGRPACHYRIAGALEVLAGEGWIVASRLGADSRDTRFSIQASRYPAIPTAGQIKLLPPPLQVEYHEFLRRDAGLDLADWEQTEQFEIGSIGLKLGESSFLMPVGIKTEKGVDVLMPAGIKDFFLSHNYSRQAVKNAPEAGDQGPPAVRNRLRGVLDIESDLNIY